MISSSPMQVGALLKGYEDLAVAWDAEVNARKGNKIFDRLHAIALLLKSIPEGQEGLEALLLHPNRGVRLKAASDCLAWNSAAAIATLEDLIVARGTHSFTAKITLEEFRAGRMTFDW